MVSKGQPRWLSHLLRSKRSYIQRPTIENKYKAKLLDFYDWLAPPENSLLGLFPIAHEEQSSSISRNPDGDAILFDVGQSVIQKSAFAALFSTDPESTTFELLKSAGSLRVSNIDGWFAERLGDCRTNRYDGPPLVKPELLVAAQGSLRQCLGPESQPLFNDVVDASILAHEIYHYRCHAGLADPFITDWVSDHFEGILDMARYGEELSPSDQLPHEKRGRYERERESKLRFFLSNREQIQEEVACDLFALVSIVKMFRPMIDHSEGESAAIKTILASYNVSLNLHLLHLAFLDYSHFRMDNDLSVELPGNHAFFNLRRIAVNMFSAGLFAGILSEEDTPDRNSDRLYSEMAEFLSSLYVEMSDKVLMPTIPRLMSAFGAINDYAANNGRPPQEGQPNPKHRVALSALPPRLDKHSVTEMFGQNRFGGGRNWLIMSEAEALEIIRAHDETLA